MTASFGVSYGMLRCVSRRPGFGLAAKRRTQETSFSRSSSFIFKFIDDDILLLGCFSIIY